MLLPGKGVAVCSSFFAVAVVGAGVVVVAVVGAGVVVVVAVVVVLFSVGLKHFIPRVPVNSRLNNTNIG